MPAALRSRIALIALAVVLATAGIAAAVSSGSHEPRASVGTEGDGRTAERRSSEDGLVPGVPSEDGAGDTDEVVSSGGSTTTTRPRSRSTTTTAPAGSTTSTTATPAAEPRTLSGRIAWLESDAELGQFGTRLWSMRPDGSDRRPELPRCSPGGAMGSWLDVSPDGTRVAIDCGGVNPADDAAGTGVTVQDVATGASTTLYHHGWFQGPTLRWSNDGTRLAAATFTTLHLIDADDLEVHELPMSQPLEVPVVTWAPDDRSLLSEHGDVIDVATGTVVRHPELVEGAVPGQAGGYSHQVRWGIGGRMYLQASWQTTAAGTFENHHVLFDVDPATNVRTALVEQSAPLGRVEFLPGGRLFMNEGTTAAFSVGADGSGRSPIALGGWEFNTWSAARGTRAASGGVPTTG